MNVQPKKYEDLKPFLEWWNDGFEPHVFRLSRVAAFVLSLSVEHIHHDDIPRQWWDHLTAFRRLRQDARRRVVKKFFAEKRRSDG